ncbi:c-type cytochrome [Microvirga zambiensis]|uniref:c-type cytochrome n=1 Tax=Microvirga zambiensis TaxID=1402137 RepID=UPI0031B5D240
MIVFTGVIGALLGFGKAPRSSRTRTRSHPDFNADTHLAGMQLPAPLRLRQRAVQIGLVMVLLMGTGVYAGYQIKITRDARFRAIALTGGDPDLGRRLIRQYGCAGCHTIPGASGAQGKVGPTLDGFAARLYIGGVAANSPDILVRWIEDPRSIDPKTAMPATGISHAEARHVAAYLYSLR